MEDTVHLPSRREAKVIGVGGDNLRNLERAFSLRGQFPRGEVDFQVVRVQQNLHSYFPRSKLCSNPFLYHLSGLSVSSGSLFTSGIQKFETFVESREEHLSNGQIHMPRVQNPL